MNKKLIIGISIVLGVLMFTSVFASLYYFDAGEFLRLSRADTEGGAQSMLATSSQFQVNGCGEGTVLDRVTNICWQRNWSSWRDFHGTTLNWTEARDYCDELQLAQKKDWSLPTVKEFRRVVSENIDLLAYYNSQNDNSYFRGLGFQFNSEDDGNYVGGIVWTQTEQTIGSTAWFVRLDNGDAYWNNQHTPYRAVCSRWNN